MPSTPSKKRGLWRRMGLLDEDRFYDLLSKKCNYMDEENVKMFYLGLVKLITEELRNHDVIRLPHIGDFEIKEIREGRSMLAGKTPYTKIPIRMTVDKFKAVKFYPKRAWREYFRTKGKLE